MSYSVPDGLEPEQQARRARLLGADVGARVLVVEVRDAFGGAVAGAAVFKGEACVEDRSAAPAMALGAAARVPQRAVVQVVVGVDRAAVAVRADGGELELAVDLGFLVDLPDVVAADEVVELAAGVLDALARAHGIARAGRGRRLQRGVVEVIGAAAVHLGRVAARLDERAARLLVGMAIRLVYT